MEVKNCIHTENLNQVYLCTTFNFVSTYDGTTMLEESKIAAIARIQLKLK